jgi:hypothetical protein
MAGGEQFNDDVDNELAHLLGETENSSGDRPDYGTGLARFLARMDDVVDCLLRLSVTIRDPAPYDQFKSRVDTSQYEPHDINHVREKFPKLDPRVIMRLGKASTQRRGYFKYREDHHRRLQEGLRPDGDVHQGSEGGGTTVASPIPQHLSDSTQLNYAMPDTASSETSATSYARSINLDASEIHLPPLPKEHADGPFLCPFCFMIISADTRHEWKYVLLLLLILKHDGFTNSSLFCHRKHVFRDLRPYVCIWNDCVSTGQDFQKRKDWISHMTREHWRQWDCPFGCSTPLDDSRALESHLKGIHAEKLDTRRATEILVRISRIDTGKANGDCPLCWNFEVKSIRQYASHVGHHLEQLALFALPNLDECEEEDREDRASQTNEDEKRKADSLKHPNETSKSEVPDHDKVEESPAYAKKHTSETSSESGSSVQGREDEGSSPEGLMSETGDHSELGVQPSEQIIKPGVLGNHPENDAEQARDSKRTEDREGSLYPRNAETHQPHERDKGQPSNDDLPISLDRLSISAHRDTERQQPRDSLERPSVKAHAGSSSSSRSKYVREKIWYCAWCNFGPLDWTYDRSCVECGRQRDQYCRIDYKIRLP